MIYQVSQENKLPKMSINAVILIFSVGNKWLTFSLELVLTSGFVI